jgi:hypothetical protein
MFALLCFVLAVLVSPFKSKSRLEAENAALRHPAKRSAAQGAGPGLAHEQRSLDFRPALSMVSIDLAGAHGRSSRDARALASAGIEMPPAVRFRPRVPQPLRDRRTNLQDPTADGLVADVQASRGQQILDVAVAQGEPQIEPNRVANDAGREAVANVRNGVHHHSYLIHRVTVTMPYL